MADINNELNAISNAIYGEDVRGSIKTAIKKINDERYEVDEEAVKQAVTEYMEEHPEIYDGYTKQEVDDMLSDIQTDIDETIDGFDDRLSSAPTNLNTEDDTANKTRIIHLGLYDLKRSTAQEESEKTELCQVINSGGDNVTYYIPPGNYVTNTIRLTNRSNVTLYAEGARIVLKSITNGAGPLVIQGCTRINIIGGVYDGNCDSIGAGYSGLNTVGGIILNNSKYTYIKGTTVCNIGNINAKGVSGIKLYGDCSHSQIINVTISDISSGIIASEGYIFATGLNIISDGALKTRDLLVKNIRIYNIGYRKEVENETIVRYNYITRVDGVNYSPDIYKFHTDKCCIDGDAIFINQSEAVSGSHDSDDFSNIVIDSPFITHCSKRAFKIKDIGVTIIDPIVDLKTWSTCIEFQYNSCNKIIGGTIKNRSASCIASHAGYGRLSLNGINIFGPDDEDDGLYTNYIGVYPYVNGTLPNPPEFPRVNGIVLGSIFGNNQKLNDIVDIVRCYFNNVSTPIACANASDSDAGSICELLNIDGCSFKNVHEDCYIYLKSKHFSELKSLIIKNLIGLPSEITDISKPVIFDTSYDEGDVTRENPFNITCGVELDLSSLGLTDYTDYLNIRNVTADKIIYGGHEIVQIDKTSYLEDGSYDFIPSGASEPDFTLTVSDNAVSVPSIASASANRALNISASKNIVLKPNVLYTLTILSDVTTENDSIPTGIRVRLHKPNGIVQDINGATVQVIINSNRKIISFEVASACTCDGIQFQIDKNTSCDSPFSINSIMISYKSSIREVISNV